VHRSSTKSPDFSFSESSRPKKGVSLSGIHYRGVSMIEAEIEMATYITDVIQDALFHVFLG
jgi:hypothetical protein